MNNDQSRLDMGYQGNREALPFGTIDGVMMIKIKVEGDDLDVCVVNNFIPDKTLGERKRLIRAISAAFDL